MKHYIVELKHVVNANNNGFNRYDIIIRLLAIENYYGKNDFGWNMYKKMRLFQLKDEQKVENVQKIFCALIESMENDGYQKDSEIYVDKNMQLVNGSHRIALALFRNEQNISCRIVHKKSRADYSLVKLKYMGFTDSEVDVIKSKYRSVMQVLN